FPPAGRMRRGERREPTASEHRRAMRGRQVRRDREGSEERSERGGEQLSGEIGRERYALLYGPTTGDRIRLADTDLLIEVEEDLARGPMSGDEAVFGGGKVIRESMGQASA